MAVLWDANMLSLLLQHKAPEPCGGRLLIPGHQRDYRHKSRHLSTLRS